MLSQTRLYIFNKVPYIFVHTTLFELF